MLLLDLDLAHITRMLNDLRDIRLVSPSYFTRNALSQVRESTIHPILPEDTDTVAKWRKVGFDHAESTMDGPEDEEHDEEVMRVPEALKVRPSRLFRSGERDRHQRE